MSDPEVIRLNVVNGGLLEAPVYENRKDGSNWCAIIDLDPKAKGGVTRRFLDFGKGPFLYLVEPVTLFDSLEFGADFRHHRVRKYGVVTLKTSESLIIELCEDAKKAVLLAREKRSTPRAVAKSLEQEREEILHRLRKIEDELAKHQEIAT